MFPNTHAIYLALFPRYIQVYIAILFSSDGVKILYLNFWVWVHEWINAEKGEKMKHF